MSVKRRTARVAGMPPAAARGSGSVAPAASGGRTSTTARIVLGVLAVDGVLSAVAGALLLPLYLGPVPFPISALLSGLLNAALVWAAGHWTDNDRIAGLPLWTWLGTVAVLTLGGPGGDIVFGGPGIMGYSVLILMILGAAPAVVVLRRMR